MFESEASRAINFNFRRGQAERITLCDYTADALRRFTVSAQDMKGVLVLPHSLQILFCFKMTQKPRDDFYFLNDSNL